MLDINKVKPRVEGFFPFEGTTPSTWLDVEIQANRLRNEEDALASHYLIDISELAGSLSEEIAGVPPSKREYASASLDAVQGVIDPLCDDLLPPLANTQLFRCISYGASYMNRNASRQALPMLPSGRTNLLPVNEKLYYEAILNALLIGHCTDRAISHLRLASNTATDPVELQSSMTITQLAFNAAKEKISISPESFADTLQQMRRPLTREEESKVGEWLSEPYRPGLLQTLQHAYKTTTQPRQLN